jgi:hypothetical protein
MQDARTLKGLIERANKGEKYAQDLLKDTKRKEDYLAGKNTEPPGYDLGHHLGDKLGEKPGRLESSDMNRGKGTRTGL